MSLSITAPDAEWIADISSLRHWLAAIPSDGLIGLDTEFMRRNTFYPQLALLQLSWEEHYALVDPLAFPIGEALQSVLGRPGVVTVMHSAGEDLETLAPLLPHGPAQLYDTQIGAAFAGMGLGISYRALVAEIVGDELDKGETRSDWMQRPLSAAQASYATLDVVHLQPIHRRLRAALDSRGYADWHAQDCARLCQRASQHEGDAQPQRNFRAAADWSPGQQALLRRVLLWRDRTARALDKPRPWLLEDALVLSLAEQPPATLSALEQRCRGQRALRSAQCIELKSLLERPVEPAELDATSAIPAHPQGSAKQALGAMKQCVDKIALELDLPAGLLCPRKILEEYAVTREWPDFLRGWREQVLGQPLPPLLPG